MLEVTINGKLTKVPPCTCGKCIVRRLRKDFFSSFPYNKDLASTYKNDYDWKTNTQTTQMKYITDQNTMVLKGHIKSIFLLH